MVAMALLWASHAVGLIGYAWDEKNQVWRGSDGPRLTIRVAVTVCKCLVARADEGFRYLE